jgi:hypothetical protein
VTVLSSNLPILPAYCSPGRKGLSTGVADPDAHADALLTCDEVAEYEVSSIGRFAFDDCRGRIGNSIGAPLLHTGIHGGCAVDVVGFLGGVSEVVVVEIEFGRVG